MTGLKSGSEKIVRSRREGKEEDRKRVRAFSDGCTLVKVPAFTANDPVFVFITSMRHLSRYFRLTPALNGSVDISRAMHVYTRCAYARIYRSVYMPSRLKRVVFANVFSVLTYYIIASRSSSIVEKNISMK